MFRKVKSLEQSFRNMQGLGGQVSVAYKDLCLFPDVQLPAGFKMPRFDLYDGHRDPVVHLRGFYSKMRGARGKDELLMAYFSQSLSSSALEWYTRQDHERWYTGDDLAQAFACHFHYNLEIILDRLSVTKIEKKHNESFREYGFRWKEQALEPTYYGHLVSDIGKFFNEVVKMGSMELIDTNLIEVKALEVPNINQNPLPTHQETNMIEIMHKEGEPKKPLQIIMMIRSSEVKPVEKLTSEISVIKLNGTNRVANKPVVIVEGARTNLIIIKPITQLPIFNSKAIPWNYERVTVTYKGKEVKEEVYETHGLTRSGRCFASEELRKAKTSKDNPVLVKKVVTEEEAKEFLRKMKLVEGSEHNRALYLTVKCEDSVVTLVLVDNDSSVNICPPSTLNKLKVKDERIQKNSICIQGFDGGGKESVGDIVLELTIGLVEFTMEFQVLDVAISYNLLLGRPWIHAAKVVPSTLHQMVKFEWDRQEIVVHGEDNLCAHSDAIVLFIEVEDDKEPWVDQVFETVSVEKIPKGKCVPIAKVTAVSVIVAFEMLKNGFVHGKGLGASLQGIVQLVALPKNLDTFDLGFKPTVADVRRARKMKQRAWVLPKPVPHLSRSFIRPGTRKCPVTTVPNSVVDVDEDLIERFERLFADVNIVEVGEGSSKVDVQFVGPSAKLNNWEATPLPTRKEFW
ncbi:uncharacterized protein [Nicotiana sylvestris]|uniref:uncharacterized protein n=1 Tax=Nicotiana sylvestris TaxID=4096 RepID=UPI00388C5898